MRKIKKKKSKHAKSSSFPRDILRVAGYDEGGPILPAFTWHAPDPAAPVPPQPELDDSPRDPADVRRFHRIARQILDLAPWKDLYETQPVAVTLRDGRSAVLKVLGNAGNYFAVSVFPDYANAQALATLMENHIPPLSRPAFRSIWQWQLSFGKKSELQVGEAAELDADTAVSFPRGLLPSGTAYVPGFHNAPLGGRELRDVTDILEEACNFFASDDVSFVPEPGFSSLFDDDEDDPNPNDTIASWAWDPDEEGYDFSLISPASDYIFPLDLPPDLLAAYRALPVRSGLRLSFAEVLVPTRDPKVSPRTWYLRSLPVFDGNTGMILRTSFVDHPPTRAWTWADSMSAVAKACVELGYVPSSFSTFSCYLPPILARLASLQSPGVSFDPHSDLSLATSLDFLSRGAF